jgi:hypothetical protein
MLRLRGYGPTLHFGARNDPGSGPIAHVWVSLDSYDVVGGEEAQDFVVLATFQSAELRDGGDGFVGKPEAP